jgi:lysozyme
MIKGIDVSHWQDDNSTPQKMNFTLAAEMGAKFVFIKASERGGIDNDFVYNWHSAKDAGLLRGAYHFLRWDLSGVMQARIFCELLKDDPGELPPVADFEAPAKNGQYPSNALLAQFLDQVETTLGKKPMIYTSPGYWNTNGKIKGTGSFDPKWAYYPLWIAHYTTADQPMQIQPWKGNDKPWTFWQYTSTGNGPAFGAESKGLDLNWFNGDMQDLLKFAGQDEEPEPPPVVPPGTTINIESLKLKVNDAINQWAENI